MLILELSFTDNLNLFTNTQGPFNVSLPLNVTTAAFFVVFNPVFGPKLLVTGSLTFTNLSVIVSFCHMVLDWELF